MTKVAKRPSSAKLRASKREAAPAGNPLLPPAADEDTAASPSNDTLPPLNAMASSSSMLCDMAQEEVSAAFVQPSSDTSTGGEGDTGKNTARSARQQQHATGGMCGSDLFESWMSTLLLIGVGVACAVSIGVIYGDMDILVEREAINACVQRHHAGPLANLAVALTQEFISSDRLVRALSSVVSSPAAAQDFGVLSVDTETPTFSVSSAMDAFQVASTRTNVALNTWLHPEPSPPIRDVPLGDVATTAESSMCWTEWPVSAARPSVRRGWLATPTLSVAWKWASSSQTGESPAADTSAILDVCDDQIFSLPTAPYYTSIWLPRDAVPTSVLWSSPALALGASDVSLHRLRGEDAPAAAAAGSAAYIVKYRRLLRAVTAQHASALSVLTASHPWLVDGSAYALLSAMAATRAVMLSASLSLLGGAGGLDAAAAALSATTRTTPSRLTIRLSPQAVGFLHAADDYFDALASFPFGAAPATCRSADASSQSSSGSGGLSAVNVAVASLQLAAANDPDRRRFNVLTRPLSQLLAWADTNRAAVAVDPANLSDTSALRYSTESSGLPPVVSNVAPTLRNAILSALSSRSSSTEAIEKATAVGAAAAEALRLVRKRGQALFNARPQVPTDGLTTQFHRFAHALYVGIAAVTVAIVGAAVLFLFVWFDAPFRRERDATVDTLVSSTRRMKSLLLSLMALDPVQLQRAIRATSLRGSLPVESALGRVVSAFRDVDAVLPELLTHLPRGMISSGGDNSVGLDPVVANPLAVGAAESPSPSGATGGGGGETPVPAGATAAGQTAAGVSSPRTHLFLTNVPDGRTVVSDIGVVRYSLSVKGARAVGSAVVSKSSAATTASMVGETGASFSDATTATTKAGVQQMQRFVQAVYEHAGLLDPNALVTTALDQLTIYFGLLSEGEPQPAGSLALPTTAARGASASKKGTRRDTDTPPRGRSTPSRGASGRLAVTRQESSAAKCFFLFSLVRHVLIGGGRSSSSQQQHGGGGGRHATDRGRQMGARSNSGKVSATTTQRLPFSSCVISVGPVSVRLATTSDVATAPTTTSGLADAVNAFCDRNSRSAYLLEGPVEEHDLLVLQQAARYHAVHRMQLRQWGTLDASDAERGVQVVTSWDAVDHATRGLEAWYASFIHDAQRATARCVQHSSAGRVGGTTMQSGSTQAADRLEVVIETYDALSAHFALLKDGIVPSTSDRSRGQLSRLLRPLAVVARSGAGVAGWSGPAAAIATPLRGGVSNGVTPSTSTMSSLGTGAIAGRGDSFTPFIVVALNLDFDAMDHGTDADARRAKHNKDNTTEQRDKVFSEERDWCRFAYQWVHRVLSAPTAGAASQLSVSRRGTIGGALSISLGEMNASSSSAATKTAPTTLATNVVHDLRHYEETYGDTPLTRLAKTVFSSSTSVGPANEQPVAISAMDWQDVAVEVELTEPGLEDESYQ